MATCLSVGSKKKRKHKVSNAYTKINGVYERNIPHEIEEYEWMQQQKILISRAHAKPTQYVILSQKEIHDTIEKTLNKYAQPGPPNIHWHWVHDRFEPVIISTQTHREMIIMDETHHNHKHSHSVHSNCNRNDDANCNINLLRMNGNVLPKCASCFRGSMKSEYVTQNDVLYLIKYALKLFIEYRTRYKHSCVWRQMMDDCFYHSSNSNNHDEIMRFHSHFEYCKPLIPIAIANNPAPPPTAVDEFEGDLDHEHSMKSITQCTYHTNTNTRTTTHLNNNHTLKGAKEEDYFVPKQYQKHHSVSDIDREMNRKKKQKKKENKKRRKELKRELNAIRENYHSMLKDYNKLQNFLSRKGIHYDAAKENQENHLNDPYSQSINSNLRNLDSLQSENERLWIELERIQNEKREIEHKYILSHNEQMRLANENIELKSQMEALKEEMHSNTSCNEEDMIQRIFDAPECDNNNNNNNDFYLALATLYDMKYDDDIEEEDAYDDEIRMRARSSSLLPVDVVARMRLEEDIILQNEFNLFRLLIDDECVSERIRAQTGSQNLNYRGIDALVDYVSSSQFDIDSLCNFLPLILFKTSQFEKEIKSNNATCTKHTNYSFLLISRLSKRKELMESAYDDIAQKLLFLAQSYSQSAHAHKIFTNSYKIWTNDFVAAAADDEITAFWRNLFDLKEGCVQETNKCFSLRSRFRDPVLAQLPPICGVKVCRELSSANKPILCEIYVDSDNSESDSRRRVTSSHIIIKKGDDLRKDYAMISIFKFMNYIWKKERDDNDSNDSKYQHLSFGPSIVKILTFGVQPFTSGIGGIQLIGNCVPLRHAANLASDMKAEHFYQLITSAAAAYIGSFVCGVRDRHFENILIRVADCTLFHIDFGYCCGETIKFSLDASPFGITAALKDLMNTNENLYCNQFIPSCCDCFMALRANSKSLIKFAQLAFSHVKKESEIETFIKQRLKIDQKNKKWNQPQFVRKWLTKQLMTEPKCNKTKTKNKIRKFLSPTMIDLDQKLQIK